MKNTETIGKILMSVGAIGVMAVFAYGFWQIHAGLGIGFISFIILILGVIIYDNGFDNDDMEI